MLTPIKLFTRLSSICPVCIADESESLGSSAVSVLGKEDSGDMPEPREYVSKVVLFCKFRDLVQTD